MKFVVWFWNLIFYNLFRWENYVSRFIGYPIQKILRNKKVKEQYEKRGVKDADELVNKAIKNPRVGINSILAGGHMYLLIILLAFGLLFIYSALIGHHIRIGYTQFLYIIAPSFIVNYFSLFKDDKYLSYFKEFEKMPAEEKKRWGWVTFSVVLLIWGFSIGSLIFMINVL
jgi:hypothetical protein